MAAPSRAEDARRAAYVLLLAMRVIAGTYRSRLLSAPPGLHTRPTSDRLRETLFNVLTPRIGGAVFADLYAGTGAVGIEALSRGAAHITFVENAPAAVACLRANLRALGIASSHTLEQRGVPEALRKMTAAAPAFTIVYLDPPWESTREYAQALTLLGQTGSKLLAPDALVIAEHARRTSPAPGASYGSLSRYRVLEQGDAALSFYRQTSP
jgi:16S rRNA (guanine966-N2)-methyltransferase